MSKEDSAAGLLSKMVKFVRNPATNWSDLDAAPTDRDEAMSKQLLKEMIERKRRNDFVRKREFDMLRKMRKREAMVGVGQDPGGRPSFFQSSMPSKPDDRATTLKKIDEIEAQMSQQWWKTKGSSADTSVHAPLGPDGRAVGAVNQLASSLPNAYRGTAPAALQSAERAAAQAAAAAAGQDQAVTQPDLLSTGPAPLSRPVARPASPPVASGLAASGGNDDSSSLSSFSPSKFNAVQAEEIVAHDAELEEAAIRFANGDDAGAEAGLLEMLAGQRAEHLETWLTLFDLYRATGRGDEYETAAIKFVQRFNRSAPQWFSLPEMVSQLSDTAGKRTSGPAADWICPSILGIQTVAALKAAIAKAPMPWRLEWKNLKTIEPSALEPLTRVFSGWAAQPVQLRFMGDAQLQRVLQAATPSGERDTDQQWWKLRMEVLRVTHRPDDFELAALDFCVTYEVSPPAWDSARCDYKPLDSEGDDVAGHTIIGDVYRDSTPSSLSVFEGDTQMDGMSSQLSGMLTVELSGQIQGDAIDVLDQLEVKLMGADLMIISCPKLIRVDFSAAGTLLNWVSAREGENRSVQFSEVNRLVALFFNVIGITEHSRVLVRLD